MLTIPINDGQDSTAELGDTFFDVNRLGCPIPSSCRCVERALLTVQRPFSIVTV